MSRQRIPTEVLDAAHARARARAARDWPEADRLKTEIEAAGWKIVDHGTDFALSPANPPDVVEGDRVRFGSSASVPSRLGDPPDGLATVVLVATDELDAVGRALTALKATSPAGTSVVIVGDGLSTPGDEALEGIVASVTAANGTAANVAASDSADSPSSPFLTEIVGTSERLGPAAALNIGIRRARGRVAILLDSAVEPTGDIVTPLVAALDDPTVAVAGGWGSVTQDGRRFEDGPPGDVDAIDDVLLAFRRSDAAERGPLDERFRTARFLALWWSLTLRDGGEAGRHRRAVTLENVPAIRHGGVRRGPADPELERLLRRDLYRYIGRFGSRSDLWTRGRTMATTDQSLTRVNGP